MRHTRGGYHACMGIYEAYRGAIMHGEIPQPHDSIIKHTSYGLNKNQSTGAEIKDEADWESCNANHSPSACMGVYEAHEGGLSCMHGVYEAHEGGAIIMYA